MSGKKTDLLLQIKKKKNWVKITGYFIDKKWKKAKKEMWIKDSKVSKR